MDVLNFKILPIGYQSVFPESLLAESMAFLRANITETLIFNGGSAVAKNVIVKVNIIS